MKIDEVGVGTIVKGVLGLVAVIFLVSLAGKVTETVGQDEVVIMQAPVTGTIHCWTDPGMKWQLWGELTRYRKSEQYWFSASKDQGTGADQSIKVRFNDNGHGNISGSLRFEMPLDCQKLKDIRQRFPSQQAVEQQLIRTIVERAVYMSGPLMSSKESAAERRSDLIQFIEDQVMNGVFRTETDEVRIVDPLSGKDKTVSRVRLVKDPKSPNGVARQEESPLVGFGIRTYNFTINGLAYDEEVEKQLKEQQAMLMKVQTAMAEAKEAEQKAITAEKQGQAAAAQAKWRQEVEKATEVTRGEQQKAVALLEAHKKKEVAELAVVTAGLYKREQTLIGEGEAARRRAVMTADGALDAKLQAWVEVQKAWAAEVGKQRWVPEVVFGRAASEGGNAATDLMGILAVRAARDLALDPSMRVSKSR
ncbi:hypothetical protein HY628_01800 [Candidatus Uhrbacteria bacterium]|nr:hypothetical protein [Candidatus Uhrbacteria bacterium]